MQNCSNLKGGIDSRWLVQRLVDVVNGVNEGSVRWRHLIVRPVSKKKVSAIQTGEIKSQLQVVLLQTSHYWANAGVLFGERMRRERGSFRGMTIVREKCKLIN